MSCECRPATNGSAKLDFIIKKDFKKKNIKTETKEGHKDEIRQKEVLGWSQLRR